MGIQQFRLPDVGEGLVEAEIVSWKVKVGDTVKLNDTIVEIETAKSLVELPVPYAGVVTELLVPEGETVDVGTPIISVQTTDAAGDVAPAPTGTGAEDMVPTIPDGEEIEAPQSWSATARRQQKQSAARVRVVPLRQLPLRQLLPRRQNL